MAKQVQQSIFVQTIENKTVSLPFRSGLTVEQIIEQQPRGLSAAVY